MGITFAQPLAVGNAIQLGLTATAPGTYWRVLRRLDGNFAGATDPSAAIVTDACTQAGVLDTDGLNNGTPVYYAAFLNTAGTWTTDGAVFAATPDSTYGDLSSDPLTVVRDRMRLAMTVEVARGTFVLPEKAKGVLSVHTAPFQLAENVTFPCISVHLDSDQPAERALAEELQPDTLQADGTWLGSEGWLARSSIAIVGVSLNPDERIALRKAIRRAVIANLPVFQGYGMIEIGFSQSDSEDAESSNAPLFRSDGAFTCLAPALVGAVHQPISDVTVSGTAYPENITYGPV